MFRTLGLVTVALCAACNNGGGTSAYCPNWLELTSPCGVESATSTCSTSPVDCTNNDQGTICAVGPVTASCTVSVTLGDGTQHSFPVTFGTSPDSICQVDVVTSTAPDFTSSTCTQQDASPE